MSDLLSPSEGTPTVRLDPLRTRLARSGRACEDLLLDRAAAAAMAMSHTISRDNDKVQVHRECVQLARCNQCSTGVLSVLRSWISEVTPRALFAPALVDTYFARLTRSSSDDEAVHGTVDGSTYVGLFS